MLTLIFFMFIGMICAAACWACYIAGNAKGFSDCYNMLVLEDEAAKDSAE